MKSVRSFFLVAASTILLSTSNYGNPASVLEGIRAKTSWKPLASPEGSRIFDGKTLHGYRRADASLFTEYGFTELTIWQLSDDQSRVVTVELYEMVDSPAAYGIYTFLRRPAAQAVINIGHVAALNVAELTFQQDRYYVVLKPASKARPTHESLMSLARAISQTLPSKLIVPLVTEKLPVGNRVEASDVFFMGPECLSHFVRMDVPDPFGLGIGAEAAMAKYKSEGESATLLLIQYPTQQLAKKFLDSAYAHYLRQYPDQPVFYKRDGPMVVLVLDSNSPELATTLLDQVTYVSMVTWDPKVEPPTIAQVMIRIFLFCGIMLAMTLAAGFVFAFFRLSIKRLFPGKVFDRPQDMEVIRLNLDAKK
jgi:hypothetical protein